MSNAKVNIGRQVVEAPHVSVIMPAFNVASYISGAIKSLLSQSYTGYEIIVVNDGSPDTAILEESLRPYADQIIYAVQDHAGVAAARNTALRLARASVVAQLDPDDEWVPDFLEAMLSILKRSPELDLVYSNSIIFGGSVLDGNETMQLTPSSGEVTFERLISQKCTVLSSLIGKKEIFFRAGCFDESLRASEDFDMWLRIVKVGGRIDYHRQPLARYRRRPDSLSADNVMMCRSILKVLSKTERTQILNSEEQASLEQSKLKWTAFLNLCEGKRAMMNEEIDLAIDRLTRANQFYKKPKISLMIRLLRVAPRLALNVLRIRFE